MSCASWHAHHAPGGRCSSASAQSECWGAARPRSSARCRWRRWQRRSSTSGLPAPCMRTLATSSARTPSGGRWTCTAIGPAPTRSYAPPCSQSPCGPGLWSWCTALSPTSTPLRIRRVRSSPRSCRPSCSLPGPRRTRPRLGSEPAAPWCCCATPPRRPSSSAAPPWRPRCGLSACFPSCPSTTSGSCARRGAARAPRSG
mmetsp:Transcript_44619/g.129809  ORF Transcript_44619/g.129809 Transcript_44619/m.129809 type:complete len:200 (-) Transcript_44619:285-884(-)